MRLTLLCLFWTLATRNERSAMVRVVSTRGGRRLLVRVRSLHFSF